jgi:hypothetical protein
MVVYDPHWRHSKQFIITVSVKRAFYIEGNVQRDKLNITDESKSRSPTRR